MSTSYYKSRYFPSRSTSARAQSPMEQYNELTTRYQQLTDKYVNLKQKYRDVSKYSPWSHADSQEPTHYKSPSPAAPRAASRAPEPFVSSRYRTPPPMDYEESTPLTSEAIMRKYRSPLVERQVDIDTPRFKKASLIDKELEILCPRYKQREVSEARRPALRTEATPPRSQMQNGVEAAAPVETVTDALPPIYLPKYEPNKYTLTYQHHPVNKRRSHANVPQYEYFTPVRVTPSRKTGVCSARDLSEIITEPSGGVYVLPNEAYNEVYPDVFIGDMHTALCTQQLRALGITHVLNAAQKEVGQEPGYYVNTSPQYYRRVGIEFLGIPATDSISFNLSPYFEKAASFIDSALHTNGRVLVHCHQGISRSATLVLAFLMLRRGMSAQDAVRTVRSKRQIIPNESFLRQLCELNSQLMGDRRNYYRK